MTRLIVEPGNPYDLTDDEERELLAAMRESAPNDDVRVVRRPEQGYGVTLHEVVHVFVENPELVPVGAGALAGLVRWLRARWRKDGRIRVVPIYGPDGRALKTIRIEGPHGDPIEGPPDEDRKPPATP
jgi:hypothetical protein